MKYFRTPIMLVVTILLVIGTIYFINHLSELREPKNLSNFMETIIFSIQLMITMSFDFLIISFVSNCLFDKK